MSHTYFIISRKKLAKIITFSILLTLLVVDNSKATHIVGEDMQLIYTGQGNYYKVNLDMYFDDINGDPSLLNIDLSIYPSIYRKSDDMFMTNVELKRLSDDFIKNGLGCNDMSIIRTRLLPYQGIVDLSGFTDAGGYYIVWERCCRNAAIKNIYDPSNTGEVFYLEFPPVTLRNTTPYFAPLTNQYWCKGVTQYLDFSGVDPDGDQLVYEMTAPLAGHSILYNSSPNYPSYSATASAPYDPVVWLSGYTVNNQIQGTIPLKVDANTGMLTFNANETGLFVFSVKVSEYRKGVKIGEARREFQILIQDCPVNYPPQIGLDKTFGNAVGQINVYLNQTTSVDLYLADQTTTIQNTSENITFVSVISDLNNSMFSISGSTLLFPGKDTVVAKFIISPCNYIKINTQTTERVKIVVRDNHCPIMYDTLLLDITFKIPNIAPPTIEILPTSDNKYNLFVGEPLHFLVKGYDIDPTDKLTLTGNGNGFNLGDYNMYFQNVSDSMATISSPFLWKPDCDRVGQGPWKITFTVKDNSCIYSNIAQEDVWINVIDRVATVDEYRPVNLVTANDDGLNDTFYMYNPPQENCELYFKSVSIYNAWGARIFYSLSKDFVWKPDRITENGIYFYDFDFNQKDIKGWVQVVSSK